MSGGKSYPVDVRLRDSLFSNSRSVSWTAVMTQVVAAQGTGSSADYLGGLMHAS